MQGWLQVGTLVVEGAENVADMQAFGCWEVIEII